MIEPTAELLQVRKHAADEIRRLSLVLRQVLEAQRRGERLSEAVVTDYLDQLTRGEGDQERLAKTIQMFWADR